MTDRAEPGRPPAHDLSAFDLSKRSPEQVAQSFARWKAQRKRPPAPEMPRAGHAAQPDTAAEGAAPAPAPPADAPAAKEVPAKRARPVQYSTTFSALLAAGSEPAMQRDDPPPIAARPAPRRNAPPGRRLKAASIAAGVASVLALAGGALVELSNRRVPVEAKPEVVQIRQPAPPIAPPIAAAAMRAPTTDWALRRTVDLALMKAAANTALPTVQTASKAAAPSAQGKPSTRAQDAPRPLQFVAKPFVPTPALVPATQGTAAAASPPMAVRSADPRPDARLQQGSDSASGAAIASNRTPSGVKPAEAAGGARGADAESNTPRSTTTRAANAGGGSVANGDPRGEGTGGARVGPDVAGGSAGDSDAGDTAGAGDGSTGDGAADGAPGATADGSGDGAGDASGGGAGGSDSGNANAGNGDPGDSETGDSDSGDSDSGNGGSEDGDAGGIGGAIKGALDGVGDALGGALDGDSDQTDSADE